MKTFIQHKILSGETKCVHAHTGTCTSEHIDYTKLNLHTTSTDNKQRLQAEEDSSTVMINVIIVYL